MRVHVLLLDGTDADKGNTDAVDTVWQGRTYWNVALDNGTVQAVQKKCCFPAK